MPMKVKVISSARELGSGCCGRMVVLCMPLLLKKDVVIFGKYYFALSELKRLECCSV